MKILFALKDTTKGQGEGKVSHKVGENIGKLYIQWESSTQDIY